MTTTLPPSLLPIAPLLYVAWADADLSPTERDALRSAASALPALDADARATLDDWLTPEAPPTAAALAQLRAMIRRHAAALPNRERTTMAAMCRDLALAAGADGDAWSGPEAQRALSHMDQALGLVGLSAYRTVLPGEHDVQAAEPPAVSPVDVAAVSARLGGPWAHIRSRVEGVLQDERFRYRYGLSTKARRELVLGELRAIADEGIGQLAFPGVVGANESIGAFVEAFRTLAYYDLNLLVKAGVQFGLFGGSIYFLGTEKHHRYLADVASVALPGCFAMTEQGHGSDVRSIRTTATWDAERDGFVIHTPDDAARKEWIGNAADHGQLATVFAQLHVGEEHHDVHALLVPIRDADGEPMPGVRIGDCGEKMGLNGVDNGRLWFDQVFVPRDALLDRYGAVDAEGNYASPIASPGKRFFTMLGTLVGGRVCVGAASVNVAKSALTIAVRYGDRRRQFGRAGGPETPLLDYPTHQVRLLPLVARTFALHTAFDELVQRYTATAGAVDHEEPDREVEALAAALKVAGSEHATRSIQTARECCGGQGYAARNRFAALKADSDVFTTFEGDNTVLRQLVARSLLTTFSDRFSDNRVSGFARFLVERAATTIAETNPVIARKTDTEHLADPSWHADLFRARRVHLVSSAARRMQSRIQSGMDPYEALLEVQLHLVAAADAWTDEKVVGAFAAWLAADGSAKGETGEVLRHLYELDALTRIRDGLGWFMENGYVAAPKARAIRRLWEERCEALRPHASALVNAWAIPATLLGAPIAE